MADHAVSILIDADNQASKKLSQVSKDVESSIKSIKETGGQAKKSAEFFKAISTAFGGNALGAYVGQVGEAIDKTSQFSEVQKAGGVGALAFKTGLVALTASIAFGIGNAIGNLIFQTDKWARKLEEANAKAKQLSASVAASSAMRFSDNKEDAELITDPDAKRAKYQALLGDLQKDLSGVEAVVAKGRKEVEEWNNAWMKTGNRAAFAEQAKAALATDEDRLKAMQSQQLELQRVLSDRTKENQELSRSGPLMKSLSDEMLLISAAQEDISHKSLFVGQSASLDAAKEELQLLEKKQNIAEIEEKAKQAQLGKEQATTAELMRQKEIATAKANITKEETALKTKSLGYVDSLNKELATSEAARKDAGQTRTVFTGPDASLKALREEITLMEQKKTVEAFSNTASLNTFDEKSKREAEEILRLTALSGKKLELGKAEEEQAKRIAELKESELQKIEEQNILLTQGKQAALAFNLQKQGLSKADATFIASKQAKELDRPILQATESRLLTRGSGEDPTKQVAANTADALKELQILNKRLIDAQRNSVSIKVVGGGT